MREKSQLSLTPNKQTDILIMKKLLTLTAVAASAISLSSCGPGTRPAHQDAAVGAGIGAVGGAIIGHQSGHAAEGALIGAAVGGGTGYAVGRGKERRAGY